MPSADTVLAADARAPVLYLRSFADDDLTRGGVARCARVEKHPLAYTRGEHRA